MHCLRYLGFLKTEILSMPDLTHSERAVADVECSGWGEVCFLHHHGLPKGTARRGCLLGIPRLMHLQWSGGLASVLICLAARCSYS